MDACVPNIGPRERRRRLTFGGAALVGAVALGILLRDAAAPLQLLLFGPLFAAMLGFLQHRERT